MSLMNKLRKNSKVSDAAILAESEFFDVDLIPTPIPMLNVALTGDINGGIQSGITTIAGPSKHFKTKFALEIISAYMAAKPESVLLFYDTEFGSPISYFENSGIDIDRVLHCPVENIEELKFDFVNQLDNVTKEDDVIVLVDSIGNVASKKEIEDAINEKSVADMTRAKALKGLFRMVTPKIKKKDIPCLLINHTYKEQGLYPKDIVSGGTGIYYASDNIWIVGRRKVKEGTELVGHDFIINSEKSRFLREGAKIPITVTYEGGIDKFSGLLDIAMLTGHVTSPSKGWYAKEGTDKKIRKKDLDADFWQEIMEDESFVDAIKSNYQLESGSFDDTIQNAMEEVDVSYVDEEES